MTHEGDYESEQAILGAIIYNNKYLPVVMSIIKHPSYFSFKEHQYIFRSMLELRENNIAIDALLISEDLKKINMLDVVGGPSYIALLDTCVPSSDNVAHYSKIVAEKYHVSRVLLIASNTSEKAKTGDAKAYLLIDEAIEELIELRSSLSNSARAISVFDCMPEIINNIELASEGKIHAGILTGYSEFDRMLGGGPQKGDLIFIGAEPSTGKTSLAVCLSYALAFAEQKGVIFSIESSRESIIRDRLLPASVQVNSHKLRTGQITKENWDQLHFIAGSGFLKNLKICDDSTVNINDIYSIVNMEHRMDGIDFMMIDYVQLISPVKGSGNRNNDLGEIARGLKRINKDFGIPIVCLSQLNDKSKLRDSGELLQIADVEIILSRHDEMQNIIDCDFRKNRNGIKGSIHLEFIPEYTQFKEAR